MAIKLEVNVPNPLASAATGYVQDYIVSLAGDEFIEKTLVEWGVADVTSLTAQQAGKMFFLYALWTIVWENEVPKAATEASDAKEEQLINGYVPVAE